MKSLTKIDIFMLILGFLVVLVLYILIFIIHSEGGQCAINPIEYAQSKNITIPLNLYNLTS